MKTVNDILLNFEKEFDETPNIYWNVETLREGFGCRYGMSYLDLCSYYNRVEFNKIIMGDYVVINRNDFYILYNFKKGDYIVCEESSFISYEGRIKIKRIIYSDIDGINYSSFRNCTGFGCVAIINKDKIIKYINEKFFKKEVQALLFV